MAEVSGPDDVTGEEMPSIDAAELQKVLPSRYKVLKILGRGGAGVVYKAEDTFLDKLVAIKMLRRAASPNEALRFQREAQLAGALNHPNVMSVLDFGMTEANDPYLVMSFVKGESLAQRLQRKGLLPLGQALNLFLQIANGLSHAHRRMIIHRDIKPNNVMLVKTEDSIVAQIVDFGLAKTSNEPQHLTSPGAGVGTPTYMSPEQIRGEEVDNRTDIYSFGCLMYKVLTGRPPFQGGTAIDTISMHLNDAPAPIRAGKGEPVSEVLQELVATCLQKDANDRYQSVDDIIEVLKQEIESSQTQHVSLTLSEELGPGVRSWTAAQKIYATVFVALLLLIGVGVAYYVQKVDSEKPKIEAGELTTASVTGAHIENKKYGEKTSGDPLDKIQIDHLFYKRKPGWEPDTNVNDRQLARFVSTMAPKSPFTIDLSSCSVTPSGLVALKDSRVRELNYHDHPLNHETTRGLAQISNLNILELGETDVVDPDAIRDLKKMPKLIGFGLHEVTLTQEILNSICELPHLRRLDLNRCEGGENIDWTDCQRIRSLRELRLDNTQLAPNAIKQISALTGLHRLDIKFIKLSDADVKLLGTMPAKGPIKTKLNLYARRPLEFVTDKQLEYLKKCGFDLILDGSKSGFDKYKNEQF